jgi:hypothetical protein
MLLAYDELKVKLNNYKVSLNMDSDKVENYYVSDLLLNKVLDEIEEEEYDKDEIDEIIFKNGLKASIYLKNNKKTTVKLTKKEIYSLYFESDGINDELRRYLKRCKLSKELWDKMSFLEEYVKELRYDLNKMEEM